MTPLLAPAARAHEPGLSYARVDGTYLSLTFARADLAGAAPLDDLDASRVLLAEATAGKAGLSVGEIACAPGEPLVRAAEGDGIEVVLPHGCPRGDAPWTFTAAYLADMKPGHRQYLEVGGRPTAVLSAATPTASFDAIPSTGAVARQFVGLGVEHIWTGYDHLAFLAGLVLAVRSLRAMLIVVSGFTVAHSVTLSLAATGTFTLPASLVEPAIAVTIMLVGVENFFPSSARRAAALALALGLVHGFGFAGMLAALGLPRDNLLAALLAFNGGVEIGQVVVAAVFLPLVLQLGRLGRAEQWVRWGLAGALVVAGAGWLVGRV